MTEDTAERTDRERGALHQLLAVEPDLKAAAARANKDVSRLFVEGDVRLAGMAKIYTVTEEGSDDFPAELVPVATSVPEQLNLLRDAYMPWIDAAMQKERTNQHATAEITIGNKTLTLPATALLNLEAKLAEIRKVYSLIPTLDPTKTWYWNEDAEVWEAQPEIRHRTQKRIEAKVLYEATEQHPAQVDTFTVDVRVGYTTITGQSGAIPASEKREYLERIDLLIRKVKQARMKANEAKVDDTRLATDIYRFIVNG